MSRQSLSRSDRVAQMTKQEELIAKKRQEILEKQKTAELGRAVAAAQTSGTNAKTKKIEVSSSEPTSSSPPPVEKNSTSATAAAIPPEIMAKFQNSFCNDGSFFENFKMIMDEAKKNEEAAIAAATAAATAAAEQVEEMNKQEEVQQSVSDNTEIKNLSTSNLSVVSQVSSQSMPPPPPPPPVTTTTVTPLQPFYPNIPNSIPFGNSTLHGGLSIVPTPPPPPQPQHCLPNVLPQQPCTPAPGPPVTIPSSSISGAQFFNPCIAQLPFTSINTPPPPPPPSTPLYLIPPPDPLQLNKIPSPKELDLSAIPKPELRLDVIRVPNEFQYATGPPTQQQQTMQSLEQQMQSLQNYSQQVFSDTNEQFLLPTTLETLVELVAENGDVYEDRVRSRKSEVHSALWFLFEPDSMAYRNYRNMVQHCRQNRPSNFGSIMENSNRMMEVTKHLEKSESNDEKYDPESVIENRDDDDDDSDEEYMKDMMGKNLSNLKRKIAEIKSDNDDSGDDRKSPEDDSKQERIRKRKSRWGEKAGLVETAITAVVQTNFANQNKPLLSAIQRTDPALLQYARQNYGTTNLTEEDWRKCEDHFKINLLYQDMMRKRNEIDQLAKGGKFKYEYDSDEDTSGGTWEHKLRTAEMEATQAWADALTAQSEGKHHIGDFLPPEELKKFMEKYDAKKNNRTPDLSDYKEYKLREDNIGFQMLQKLGWKEGQGLGAGGTGIVDPVNKAPQRESNQGLGAGIPSNPEECDNEYEAYRKRMMLAYRFRPNPLNNPRRAYY